MPNFECDNEIFEFAIARELQACHFFKAIAKQVDNPAMRIVLKELAEEELQHKEKLELEVLKSGHVFDETNTPSSNDYDNIVLDNQAGVDMDYSQLLQICIEKEDASVKLYTEMAAMVRNVDSRQVLLGIAEEEMRHKIKFENEYDNLISRLHDHP